MSDFDTNQTSTQQADCAELFKIERSGYRKYYTSYYRDVKYGDNTYVAFPLERGELSNEFGPEEVVCSVKGSLENVFAFLTSTEPVTQITLTITKFFIADAVAEVIFVGRMTDYSLNSDRTASATFCTELFGVMQSQIPRLGMQSSCPYVLFGTSCGLDRDTYGMRVEIVAIDTHPTSGLPMYDVVADGTDKLGQDLDDTVAAYWTNGVARFDTYYRTIVSVEDVGLTKRLVLQYTLPSGRAVVGGHFTLYPGCPKTRTACHTQFKNLIHFGGVRTSQVVGTTNALTSATPIPVFYGTFTARPQLLACRSIPQWAFQNPTLPNGTVLSYGHVFVIGHGEIDLVSAQGLNLSLPSGDPRREGTPYPEGFSTTIDSYFGGFIPGLHRINGRTPANSIFPGTTRGDGTGVYLINSWLKEAISAVIAYASGTTDPDALVRLLIGYGDFALIYVQQTAIHPINLAGSVRPADPPWGWCEWVLQPTSKMMDDQHFIQVTGTRAPTVPAAWTAYNTVTVAPFLYVNPVSVLYEILTNDLWGCGIAAENIDEASFATAAKHCYDLLYMVRYRIDKYRQASDVIKGLLYAADMTLSYGSDYKLRLTAHSESGSLTPVATLTDSDYSACSVQGQTWNDTINAWNVATPPGYTFADGVLTDDANIMLTGTVRSKDFTLDTLLDYSETPWDPYGSSQSGPARYVNMPPVGYARRAYTALRESSFPRVVAKLTVDTKLYNVFPGQCVRWTSTRYGVDALFRVTNRTLGGADSNAVTLTLRQLSDAVRSTDYSDLPENEGSDPLEEVTGDSVVQEDLVEFERYSATSAETFIEIADLSKVRVAWGPHPVLEGVLPTNEQDAANYACTVGHGVDNHVVVELRTNHADLTYIKDAVESNATGQLSVRVWEVA